MNFDLISKSIIPDSVIDIGANVGHWYREAKQHWPNATYLLIEGNRECQPMLAETRESYRIALLSDREKEVTFYTRKGSPGCTGASIYREQTEFYEGRNATLNRCVTSTLDHVVPPVPEIIGKRLLIKLDVQGSELDILRGGENVLSKTEAVVMEVPVGESEYNAGAPKLPEIEEFMSSRGFVAGHTVDTIVHPLTREHIQSDILFVRI